MIWTASANINTRDSTVTMIWETWPIAVWRRARNCRSSGCAVVITLAALTRFETPFTRGGEGEEAALSEGDFFSATERRRRFPTTRTPLADSTPAPLLPKVELASALASFAINNSPQDKCSRRSFTVHCVDRVASWSELAVRELDRTNHLQTLSSFNVIRKTQNWNDVQFKHV